MSHWVSKWSSSKFIIDKKYNCKWKSYKIIDDEICNLLSLKVTSHVNSVDYQYISPTFVRPKQEWRE